MVQQLIDDASRVSAITGEYGVIVDVHALDAVTSEGHSAWRMSRRTSRRSLGWGSWVKKIKAKIILWWMVVIIMTWLVLFKVI